MIGFSNEALTTNSVPLVSAPKKFPLSQVLLKPGRDYFQPDPGSLQELGPAHAVLARIPGDAPSVPSAIEATAASSPIPRIFSPEYFNPVLLPQGKSTFSHLQG